MTFHMTFNEDINIHAIALYMHWDFHMNTACFKQNTNMCKPHESFYIKMTLGFAAEIELFIYISFSCSASVCKG